MPAVCVHQVCCFPTCGWGDGTKCVFPILWMGCGTKYVVSHHVDGVQYYMCISQLVDEV